jgi:chaperone modulatory protein CbpM
MTMQIRDFFDNDDIEAETIAIWIEAGWLAPDREGDNGLSEIDIARARLIHDLKNNIGVNDEAVPLILDLIDQLHGLRRAMRHLVRRKDL